MATDIQLCNDLACAITAWCGYCIGMGAQTIKINEPSVFCVVYCFLSRFAKARVSLNKRRALMAVTWRPAARTCGGRDGVSALASAVGR